MNGRKRKKRKVLPGTARVVPGAVAPRRAEVPARERGPRKRGGSASAVRRRNALRAAVNDRGPSSDHPDRAESGPGMTVAVRVSNANHLPKDVRRALHFIYPSTQAVGLATAAYLAGAHAACQSQPPLPLAAAAPDREPAQCAPSSVTIDGVLQVLAYDPHEGVCTLLERLDAATSAGIPPSIGSPPASPACS